MNKAYIFVYDDAAGTREQIKAIVDAMPEITDWRYDLPNCFYIISQESAHTISEKFREQHGERGRWLILEYTPNSQGFLTKETWSLLNNKQRLPTPDPKGV